MDMGDIDYKNKYVHSFGKGKVGDVVGCRVDMDRVSVRFKEAKTWRR